MRRSERKAPWLNYAKINSQGMASNSQSEDSDDGAINEEEILDYDDDLSGSEDGEIVEESGQKDEEEPDSEEWDLDEIIKSVLESEDFNKAEALLNEKEQKCESLKATLKREKAKEQEQKKKKLKAQMEQRFQQLKKTEDNLNKSIMESRNNTPESSPSNKVGKQKRPEGSKHGGRKNSRITTGRRRTTSGRNPRRSPTDSRNPRENRGEYDALFTSVGNLKCGNNEMFAELVAKAMEASSNLKSRLPNSHRRDSCSSGVEPGQEQLFELLAGLRDTKLTEKECESLNTCSSHNSHEGQIAGSASRVSDVCTTEYKAKVNNGGSHENEGDQGSRPIPKGEFEGERSKKGKKLVSGKCTKPDESDIKQVVKYAHEKLDSRHVQDRVFDNLPFNMLVAGELEIVMLRTTPPEEREACIQIAKTVCYHKEYLGDEDLRNGYDAILKRVEQGNEVWGAHLGEELHKHYDYRANVIVRNKLQDSKNKGGGVGESQPSPSER